MSVSNQTNKIYGSGNGVTATFSYPFKIFDVAELYAYKIAANGTVTGPLVYTTDFTATISSVTEGGTITFIVPPASGTTWFLTRIVPYTQSAVIPSEGTFPGKQFENQLDLMTMMVIQANETVTRCLQLPTTYLGTLPVTLPSGQANAAIGWDPTGSFLTNVLVTAVGTVPVPIPNSFLSALITAGLVSGAALTSLASIPSGAGIIPVANIPVGTSANQVVQLDGSAKLPAVDGSALTNLPIAHVKAFSAIRDLSTASADASYTGLGFKPKALIFLGGLSSNANMSISMATAAGAVATEGYLLAMAGTVTLTNALVIRMAVDGLNHQSGFLKSFDSDGFTITWTKTGTPTGTGEMDGLAIG